MRRRRQDFSRNGPENGGLFLLLRSSDVYGFTDWVLMCCVPPVGETGPESGGSQNPNRRWVTLVPRVSGDRKQLQEGQPWKRRKAHSLPLELNSPGLTRVLSLPCSRGPKCSAAGDGGGEGGKFVVSSTAQQRAGTSDNYKAAVARIQLWAEVTRRLWASARPSAPPLHSVWCSGFLNPPRWRVSFFLLAKISQLNAASDVPN